MTPGMNFNYNGELVDRIRELDEIAAAMEERGFDLTDTERTTLRSTDSLTETLTVNWRRRAI